MLNTLIGTVIASAIGCFLGWTFSDFLIKFFELKAKKDQYTLNRITTHKYNFYDGDGNELDPKNKELLQDCLKAMEDSCEKLREDIKKLEEEESKEEKSEI